MVEKGGFHNSETNKTGPLYLKARPSSIREIYSGVPLYLRNLKGGVESYTPYGSKDLISEEREREHRRPEVLYIKAEDRTKAILIAHKKYSEYMSSLDKVGDKFEQAGKIKEIVTNWVGEALEDIAQGDVRLVESLYQTVDKLINVYDTDFLALSGDIKNLDYVTALHSTNTMVYSINYYLKNGVSNKAPFLRNIGMSALLHDIGKTKISDEILLKEEALTPEEYDIVKQHPSIGALILNDAQKRSPRITLEVIEVCGKHHERVDKTGYPMGIGGLRIPEYCQIISMADCLEAIRGVRTYNVEAISLPDAMQKIRADVDRGRFSTEYYNKFVKSFAENKSNNI